jgi:signal transduction histidine kinase
MSSNLEWKSMTQKDLLSIVLHELRTPMMVIKGYVEVLSKEDGKEYLPEAIQAISSSVERINTVCEGIAAYTQELIQNQDT